MKFYSKKFVGGELVKTEIVSILGIEIEHNGKIFTISQDNGGQLVLRSVDKGSLVIRPNASNAVAIDSEN